MGQLGLHEKPSALLDVGGFYRPLIEQLGVMAAQGYLEQAQLDASASSTTQTSSCASWTPTGTLRASSC